MLIVAAIDLDGKAVVSKSVLRWSGGRLGGVDNS